MIIDLLLKGIVTGLLLSIMIGPAFFLLIETSIRKGIRAGVVFDAGVITADIIYIVIAYLFVQQVEYLAQGDKNALVKCIGGVLFLAYGFVVFRKKVEEMHFQNPNSNEPVKKNYVKFYIKGFLLNLANPLVVFYWFSVMALGHSGSSVPMTKFNMFLYMAFVLGTFLSIDLLKIIGAKQLRPFITAKFLKSLNHIIGGVLIIFGGFLVINSIIIWLK